MGAKARNRRSAQTVPLEQECGGKGGMGHWALPQQDTPPLISEKLLGIYRIAFKLHPGLFVTLHRVYERASCARHAGTYLKEHA